MNRILLITVAIAVLFASSCKKESCSIPVDLGGTTFKGTATVSTAVNAPFTLVFNADGTATVSIGAALAMQGTWSKLPSSSIVYFFFEAAASTKWKGQGTLNAANNKLEGGVLTRTLPTAINGTFTADKQ